MRVALVPLDSRPPNYQFPQRLAAIAGIELVLPAREDLGTLHRRANGLELARWLRDTAPGCAAAVFSWDMLVYGGLVPSRDLEPPVATVEEIADALRQVDWNRVAGYSYAIIPRLGITIDSPDSFATHKTVREFFISSQAAATDRKAREGLARLESQLGAKVVEALSRWRKRNQSNAKLILRSAGSLGIKHCHFAVEDNAPQGPHLEELKQLRREAASASDEGVSCSYTFFDGADECACLLLGRAFLDYHKLPVRTVQLTVHPETPGPRRYTGLYESHSLGEGLTFIREMLKLEYTNTNEDLQWVVVHGVQPQPDGYVTDTARTYANPYLLPGTLTGAGRLFVSDLSVANGTNPHLAPHLAELAPTRLAGVVGHNTNFNALAITGGWLRTAWAWRNDLADRRFAVERLADDLVYQSIARAQVCDYLQTQRLDPFDFSRANPHQVEECRSLVQRTWRSWCDGPGSVVLEAMGIPSTMSRGIQFDFPWRRAFEIEAEAPGPAA